MQTDKQTPWLRPSVKALIVNEGKILMVKERVKRGVIYDFPGGGVEYGEDLEEALKREVFEEVGLKIEVNQAVGNWSFVLENYKVQLVCMGYQCKIEGDNKVDIKHNPAVGEDIFEFLWLTKTEMLAEADRFFRVKGMREAIERLKI